MQDVSHRTTLKPYAKPYEKGLRQGGGNITDRVGKAISHTRPGEGQSSFFLKYQLIAKGNVKFKNSNRNS